MPTHNDEETGLSPVGKLLQMQRRIAKAKDRLGHGSEKGWHRHESGVHMLNYSNAKASIKRAPNGRFLAMYDYPTGTGNEPSSWMLHGSVPSAKRWIEGQFKRFWEHPK